MVIAGGGAGGKAGDRGAGGGGAGGFRELVSPTAPYTASPLDGYPSAPNRITVTATGFPITVGAGAAARCSPNIGNSGSTSTFFNNRFSRWWRRWRRIYAGSWCNRSSRWIRWRRRKRWWI